jgi:hypothetical protein
MNGSADTNWKQCYMCSICGNNWLGGTMIDQRIIVTGCIIDCLPERNKRIAKSKEE